MPPQWHPHGHPSICAARGERERKGRRRQGAEAEAAAEEDGVPPQSSCYPTDARVYFSRSMCVSVSVSVSVAVASCSAIYSLPTSHKNLSILVPKCFEGPSFPFYFPDFFFVFFFCPQSQVQRRSRPVLEFSNK